MVERSQQSVPRFILASGSPRRREFLRSLGVTYEAATAEIDERPLANEDPVRVVQRLSLAKASAVARRLEGDILVIGADTVVVCDGEILGKPGNASDARDMLLLLRGRTHQVHSGVAVVDTRQGTEITSSTTSSVQMRWYGDAEIERYISTADPFDKAGAYAIQHAEFHPVEAIQGCYASVMGMPLCHLTAAMNALRVPWPADAARVCEQLTGHACRLPRPDLVIRPGP